MAKIKVKKKTLALFKRLAESVRPPKKMTISEWADEKRILTSESSAEPGKWRTDRAPYQKAIMDSITDPQVKLTVWKSSTQVGKTEVLLNTVAYFIDHEPAPMMLLQPTVDDAKEFSKDRIAPMIRAVPELSSKVKESKSRDSGNTITHKSFPGGRLSLAGTNAARGLAARPIRVLLCDEVDRYPASAGNEGDPIALAENRTKNFWNAVRVYVSSPTDAKTSRIQKAYEESSMEEWNLPCPYCGRFQPLKWSQIEFDSVAMRCKFCDELATEYEWKSGKGKWIAEHPEIVNIKGFHVSALVSPWESWEKIITKFYEYKKLGKDGLKVFVNTYLGEVWEDQSDDLVDYELLLNRREAYNCDVPEGVLIITAGVDVQEDRIECEVVGWGKGRESWGIQYKVFQGLPSQPQVWQDLESFLDSTFYYQDGSQIKIMGAAIDTGYLTTEVYNFLKPRERKRYFGIKGVGGSGLTFIGKPTRNNVKNVLLFPLGVDAGKERIFMALSMAEFGQDFCHFPIEPEKGYSKAYMKSLCSEKRIVKYKKGVAYWSWVKKFDRNEGLDLRNYAQAALEILNPNFEQLQKFRESGGSLSRVATSSIRKRKQARVLSKGI